MAKTPFFWRISKVFVDGGPTDQWLRIVMNERTQALVRDNVPPAANVLEISGATWRDFSGFGSYRSVFYPEFDICERALPEQFDLIIAEQVFEHLAWPYRAARNVYSMLKPGGHFLITTPFLVRIHESPLDCSRWSATGIRHFLAESGFSFDNIVSDAWGNRACVRGNFRRFSAFLPWLHSLANEPEFPVVVWAIAKK